MNDASSNLKPNAVGDRAHSEQLKFLLDTLWADLPSLFEKDISYEIYSRDIYFRDPVNTFKGKVNYRIIFWTLRFHARLFFTNIYFDLHDISQPDPDTILATWTVRGTLRVPWRAKLYFNGYSTYRLNSDRLIYEHLDTWDRPPAEILQQFFKTAATPEQCSNQGEDSEHVANTDGKSSSAGQH